MRLLTLGNRSLPWSVGGYEILWQRANAALRDRGHVLRVLTTEPDPTEENADPPSEPDVHRDLRWYWREHRFPRRSLRSTLTLERFNAKVIGRHLEEFSPDALLCWAMGGMSLSLLEQVRRAGLGSVGVIADDWMIYGPEVDGWLRRWRGRRAGLAPLAERLTGIPAVLDLDRAASWIFCSDHLRAGARQAGWALPRSSVATPGIDRRRFAPVAAGPWRWRLLYCGRVDPRKGVATSVEALAHLPQDAVLTIHGGGEAAYVESLRELGRRLGVERRVRFTSSDPEGTAAAYAAADVLVFPVRWREPWGLVPLEAMSVGRPVIASRAGGGVEEYLLEEQNCLRFPPGDAQALAAAVRRLADEPAVRERLVREGEQTAARLGEEGFHRRIEAELERISARGR